MRHDKTNGRGRRDTAAREAAQGRTPGRLRTEPGPTDYDTVCDLCHLRRAVKHLQDPPHRDAEVCAECGIERLRLRVQNLYMQIYEVERETMALEKMVLDKQESDRRQPRP